MSYTLCVIDMQDQFYASRGDDVRKACVREIKKAMRDGATILYVEFSGYGPTLPMLTSLTKGAKYKKAYRVLKTSSGGGKEVTDFIKKMHLPRLNMRIVGVNTDQCVLSTVHGINQISTDSNISIVADGCASYGGKISHSYGLKAMSEMKNVKLLRAKGQV